LVFDVTFLVFLVLYYMSVVFFFWPAGEVFVLSYANLDGVPSQSPGVTEVLAEDWNVYVRDNFDTLKRGHVRVANEAALSSLTVAIGTMVFAEAEESLHVFSSSGWVRAVGTADLRDDAVTTAKIGDVQVTAAKLAAAAVELLTPRGIISPYAAATAPAGWLICNGDTLPNGSGTVQGQTLNFASLYALLGSTYGSAGKLPDLRGRVIAGIDSTGLTDINANPTRLRPLTSSAATRGAVIGDSRLHSHNHIINDGAGSHSHGVTDPGHAHAIGARPNSTSGATYNAATTATNQGDNGNVVRSNTTGISIQSAGGHNHTVNSNGSGGSQNVPPTMMLNYIIKA